MRKKHLISICLFAYIFVTGSCSDTKKSQSIINPNGDSELALLMRDMFDEAERIKQDIEEGKTVEFTLDHAKILTAHATEPHKAASPQYKAFAKSYLQIVDLIKQGDTQNIEESFGMMVDNCMACHKSMCPGPIVKIEKLY